MISYLLGAKQLIFLAECGHRDRDADVETALLVLEIAFSEVKQVSGHRTTVKSISMLLTTAHKFSLSIT